MCRRVIDASGSVGRQVDIVAHADIVALNDAAEDGESGLGLVQRHEVTGIKYSGEGQVAVLTNMAAYVRIVDDNVGVSSGWEGCVVARDQSSKLE
jgi:hypothetical protein